MNTKQLRQKILDLAIHGKLVPQDPTEGSAEDLLREIGKARGKKIEAIIDNVPFEVPDGWCWCRLGDIFQHNTGKTLNSKSNKGTIARKYITTCNVYWTGIDLSNVKVTLFTEDEISKYTVRKGDLLVCEGGDVGRASIWNYEEEVCYQNHLHRIRPYSQLCVPFYYYMFYFYKQAGLIKGKGIGLEGLSSKVVDNMSIPLPPLAEQKRIVERVELLLNEVEAIEKAEGDIKQIANILRSKVLDLAIKGQLTDSDITGWKWEKHNNIVEISGGSQPPKSTFINEPKEGYIRLYQIRDYGDNPVPVYIPISKAGKITKKGDILLARYGASLGKVFWAEDGAYNVAMAKAIIKNSDLLDSHYLFWYYHSNYYRDVIFKISRSAQDGFNKNDIAEMTLPLPPLSEQKRIVEKIEQLFAEIDVLTR